MKPLFSILILFTLLSCEMSNGVQEIPTNNANLIGLRVVIIDGCEYLQYKTAQNYDIVTHKGNCKNHSKY